MTTELNHITPVTSIDPADAARLLTTLPFGCMPRMSWTITEMGALIASPPPHVGPAEHRAAFTAWAAYFGLDPDPEQDRAVTIHLRAQGTVDGVSVTLWSVHRPEQSHRLYDR